MDTHISQTTRNITDAEKAFWKDKDAGVAVIPPVPCRDCGLVWEHDDDCASFWDIDDISKLVHGETRHGKVWCIDCQEWFGQNLAHAALVLREVRDGV